MAARMLNPAAGRDRVLAGMLDKAYLEIIPTRTILERVVHLPQHAYVAITCSPVHGIEPTLALTAQLRALPEDEFYADSFTTQADLASDELR